MKVRAGFVSNSSSSSFVVIAEGGEEEKIPERALNPEGELPIPNDFGHYSFGWETITYTDILDRINFTLCQIMYLSDDSSFPPKENTEAQEVFDTFMEVLKDGGIKPKLIISEEDAKKEGQFIYAMSFDFYIDHQSSAIEGKNTEILDSYESMYDFIFRKGSYIQGGNDN